MADKSTLYRAQIELADTVRNRYENLKTQIAQHPSETSQRLIARLIAYALCYEPDLEHTRGICEGDSPDLWQVAPDGKIEHWIEVGLPSPERIRKAAKKTPRVTLFLYGERCKRWQGAHLESLLELPNLNLYTLDNDLLNNLARDLPRNINWSLTRTDATLYLVTNEQCHESTLGILKSSDGN